MLTHLGVHLVHARQVHEQLLLPHDGDVGQEAGAPRVGHDPHDDRQRGVVGRQVGAHAGHKDAEVPRPQQAPVQDPGVSLALQAGQGGWMHSVQAGRGNVGVTNAMEGECKYHSPSFKPRRLFCDEI